MLCTNRDCRLLDILLKRGWPSCHSDDYQYLFEQDIRVVAIPAEWLIFFFLSKNLIWWGFLGHPMVKTPCFQWRGHGLDPWSGDLTCCVMWPKKKDFYQINFLSLGVRVIFTLQNFWYNLTLSEIKLILWGIIFKLCVCVCVCVDMKQVGILFP